MDWCVVFMTRIIKTRNITAIYIKSYNIFKLREPWPRQRKSQKKNSFTRLQVIHFTHAFLNSSSPIIYFFPHPTSQEIHDAKSKYFLNAYSQFTENIFVHSQITGERRIL